MGGLRNRLAHAYFDIDLDAMRILAALPCRVIMTGSFPASRR